MKVLVFDTETTGLPKERNPSIYNTSQWPHIIQLSYILYDTNKDKMLVEHDWIIKIPVDTEMSKETENIHGISMEDSQRDGIDIVDALEYFDICLSAADVVVGHNLQFDKKMIIIENIRNKRTSGFKNKKTSEFCTMINGVDICKIYKRSTINPREKYLKYPTQSELHKKLFNQIPQGVHNSWIDILVCLRCYLMMTSEKDLFETNKSFRAKYRACI